MNKKRKEVIVGWAHKSHIQFFGRTFVGFKDIPAIAKEKDRFYRQKVRITIDEI
jgi:hypothetical protein